MIPEGFRGRAATVRLSGFEAVAVARRVELTALLAVWEVECAGSPFLADGRPALLFEAHYFSRLTAGRYDRDHPQISAPRWDRSLYRPTRDGEYQRLAAAMALDREAALKSASWGGCQILGYNHAAAGFSNVEAMVAGFCDGEAHHLSAFLAFVTAKGLMPHLRGLAWAPFARGYNGSAYRQNRYDEKLAAAYERNKMVLADGAVGIGERGEAVRRQQLLLRDAGEAVEADGIFGRMTSLAVERVQAHAGLPPTGRIDAATEQALQALAQGRGQ